MRSNCARRKIGPHKCKNSILSISPGRGEIITFQEEERRRRRQRKKPCWDLNLHKLGTIAQLRTQEKSIKCRALQRAQSSDQEKCDLEQNVLLLPARKGCGNSWGKRMGSNPIQIEVLQKSGIGHASTYNHFVINSQIISKGWCIQGLHGLPTLYLILKER